MRGQKLRRTAVIGFITPLAVLAFGCSQPGSTPASEEPTVIGDVYNGGGSGTLGFEGTLDVSPTTGWIDRSQSFYVMTYGSSSCPNAPVQLKATQAALHIKMARIGGPICTEDFGPTSYAIDLPESLQGLTRIAITLEFDEGEQTELILS